MSHLFQDCDHWGGYSNAKTLYDYQIALVIYLKIDM